VYTIVGFLPLLEIAVDDRSDRTPVRVGAEIGLCMILIGGLAPEPVKVYGMGFIGALVLWLRNLKLIRHSPDAGLQACKA
jgi:hypothetical protein